MRFEFCGDMDCPDWVLAQIQVLSRLTSVKLKILVSEIIRIMTQHDVKLEKLQSLTSTAKFDEGDVRAVTASLEFVLSSSAKHNTDGDVLSNELQQLGLPCEHAIVLSKQYTDKKEFIRASLKEDSLRLSKLERATAERQQGIASDRYSVDMPFIEGKLNDLVSQLQEVRELMIDLK